MYAAPLELFFYVVFGVDEASQLQSKWKAVAEGFDHALLTICTKILQLIVYAYNAVSLQSN